MAHSPQASGGGGPQPNPAVNMSGSMGQSQQMVPMNRGMLPPNGPQGMPGVRPMTGAHQTPQPAFQPLGPSPNQPGSPSQPGPLMAPSPSMASRQPPGMQQQQLQEQMAKDMSRIDQNSLHQLKAELNLGNKEDLSLTYDEKVVTSFPLFLFCHLMFALLAANYRVSSFTGPFEHSKD